MNKRLLIFLLCLIFIILFLAIPKKKNSINAQDILIETIRDDELVQMAKHINSWVDKGMIATLSKYKFTDDDIKKLYYEFKQTIVTPPNPETYKEYGIDDAEGALDRIEKLGKRVVSIFMAMSDKDLLKYGDLISVMRNQLCFDALHIPLAIKHDNSRDIYWYKIHMQGVKLVDEAFRKIVESKYEKTLKHES